MENKEENYFEELERKAMAGDAESQYMLACWSKRDSQKSTDLFKRSSDQGYAPAQAEYGVYLYNGDIVQKNQVEAIRLWRLAAKENEHTALAGLGCAYKRGVVVRRNYKKAIEYFEKAIELNDEVAKCELADMYLNGLGVEKNIRKAEKLYTSAANKNDSLQAMLSLGKWYLDTKEYEKAIKWMKRAANYERNFFGNINDGDADARLFLAKLYLFGCFGEYKIPVNTRMGFKYLKLAADQNQIEAMHILAEIYQGGLYGLPKNYKKSMALYEALIDAGSEDAAIGLGTFYFFGLGVKKDGKKAFEIFSQHLDKKYPISYYYLGCCYDSGVGVDIDKKKAFKLNLYAAKLGIAEAQYNVGVSYYWADGVRRNMNKMFYWLSLSAEQDFVQGQSNLAECYEKGYGTSIDMDKAIYWYEKAARQGYREAIDALQRIRKADND